MNDEVRHHPGRISIPLSRIAVPVGAVATIGITLLWTINVIPRLPVVSEVVGLLGVLIAPGIAVEPMFRGERWTLVERIGLAAALSLALDALLGVGLHIAGFPVSPANVLALLLLVATPVGALSVRFRRGRRPLRLPRRMRVEIAVGLGSLVLLAAGFVAVLVLGGAPALPPLEVMAVDDAGRLATMPIHLPAAGSNLTIVIRSASGAVSSAQVDLDGDGIRPWAAPAVPIGTGWTQVEVPIQSTTTGALTARLTVKGADAELTLLIAVDVGS